MYIHNINDETCYILSNIVHDAILYVIENIYNMYFTADVLQLINALTAQFNFI